MKLYTLPIVMLGLSGMLALNPGFAQAKGGTSSPCNKTAKQMYQACIHDVRDDLKTTLANCTNISDWNDRKACREEARLVQQEELKLCGDRLEARTEACNVLAEVRYDPDPLLDPSISFVDPEDVDEGNANPFVSIVAGHTYVLRAGEEGDEIVVVHVTDESREIQGVQCRVVVDAVMVAEEDEEDGGVEYVSVELTDDWFAQDTDGNVYYCGEIARNYEDGKLVDLDGSFEAGRDFAKAGMLIMNTPELELAHRQEFALGEAEDIVQYVDLAAVPDEENTKFSCTEAGGCLKTFDFAPLEPESTEYKYYLPGVGFVLAETMEDGVLTGEREELVCVGDSLDILEEPECEIEDPEELLEELCELSPDGFCD